MTVPAKTGVTTLAELKSLVHEGDYSKLTKEQREMYVERFCEERGLTWDTNPIRWLHLNGKLVPYAMKDLTDQLRRLNGISVEIIRETYERGILTVHVRATDKNGRHDEDFGSVPWNEKIAAEIASNLKMKAVTKAKRRVTLSISGLGWLDESEVDDIPAEAKKPQYREPETGPNMTHDEARAFGEKLMTSIRGSKAEDARRMALEMAHDEMMRMRRDQPRVYDQLNKDIDKEMAE